MKQYIKSITFLLSTTYLVSTNLSTASDPSPLVDDASSRALVPFGMPSTVTAPTVSKDLKVLDVAIGGRRDAVTLLGAAEVRQEGRGATVTVSQTQSAPGAKEGGATLIVFKEDHVLDTVPNTTRASREHTEGFERFRSGKPELEDSLDTSVLDVYLGKKEYLYKGIHVEHLTVAPGEGEMGGSTITRRSIPELIIPGFLEFRTALDRFTDGQVVWTLRGLSEAISVRMAGYGSGIVNDSLRVAMPLINKTLSFLDDTALTEALQHDMALILPALDKIVHSCERYISKKGLPLDPPSLDDVVLEGVSITDLHDASLQIERVLYMIKDNKFMNKQKAFMRNVIEKTKTSAPSSEEGRLNKAFREGLTELDALHTMFTSHTVPAFEEFRRGVIQINSLSEGIIGFAQPTHRIAMVKAAQNRWIQDYKDKFAAIADKPAREITSALVVSGATPGFVTDSTRLSAITSSYSGYDLVEKRYDLKHAIENAARYAGVPALVDGVVVEDTPLALTDAVPTMPSDGGSGGSDSGLVTAEVPTGGKASSSTDESKKG